MLPKLIEQLIRNFQKLPGIGNKTATRLTMYLLGGNREIAQDLAESLSLAAQSIANCSRCNMLAEKDPCELCQNTNRNDSQLCVVANTQDLLLVEATGEYHGRYFVLGNLLSPLDGIGPTGIMFPQLQHYVQEHSIDELILALNPSAEGESTMHFLTSQLGRKVNRITRLSTGLPFGGDIEYTSSMTLGNALRRRYKIDD